MGQAIAAASDVVSLSRCTPKGSAGVNVATQLARRVQILVRANFVFVAFGVDGLGRGQRNESSALHQGLNQILQWILVAQQT